MTIDLNLLVVFDTVMAERNMRVAAERLNRSQPAVSQSIARLRDIFADRLFEKTPEGVQPTPRAEAIWAELRDPLQRVRQVVDHVDFDPKTFSGEVTLGLSDDMHALACAEIVSFLRNRAPTLSVRTHEVDHLRVWELVKNGAVDLAVTVATRAPRGLAESTLIRQDWKVLRRADVAAPRTLASYVRHNHVAIGFSGGAPGYTDLKLDQIGAKRNVIAWTPRFASIPDLVVRTGALATMPEPIARKFLGQGGLALSKPPFDLEPTQIKLCWHERLRYDPVSQWLRECVKNAVHSAMESSKS